MNRIRVVRVVLKDGLEADGEVPQADGAQRDEGGAAEELKIVPEERLEPGDEEGREEERDGRKHRLLEGEVFAAVGFDELLDAAGGARLHGHPPEALRVWVVRVEDGAAAHKVAAVRALELCIVVCALLRVAERAVGQRDEGGVARRALCPAVYVGVVLARELSVSRLDFGRRGRPLDL